MLPHAALNTYNIACTHNTLNESQPKALFTKLNTLTNTSMESNTLYVHCFAGKRNKQWQTPCAITKIKACFKCADAEKSHTSTNQNFPTNAFTARVTLDQVQLVQIVQP